MHIHIQVTNNTIVVAILSQKKKRTYRQGSLMFVKMLTFTLHAV